MTNKFQKDFSSELFGTFFGLILYFNIQDLLTIKDPLHFIFYLFMLLVVVHWWLVFASANDAFGDEVNNSAADILFGLVYLVILEYAVLYSSAADFWHAIFFLFVLVVVDMIWAFFWKHVGRWQDQDRTKAASMTKELNCTLHVDAFFLASFFLVLILYPYLSDLWFVSLSIFFYVFYIILTFKHKIIDLKFF